MRKTFLQVVAEDISAVLSLIAVPTLVIWGKKDQFVPVSDAYVMHKQIPNSTLQVYAKADHFLPYESPAELAEAIAEFIRL